MSATSKRATTALANTSPVKPKHIAQRVFHKMVNVAGALSVAGRPNSPSYFNQAKPLHKLRPRLSGEQAQDVIAAGLRGDQPFMVGRLGNTELQALTRYRLSKTGKKSLENCFRLAGHGTLQWTDTTKFGLMNNAGFFPTTDVAVDQFCELMIDVMPEVDVLASWAIHEGVFRDAFETAKICQLQDLEPFHYANPWSAALEGKRVLVIHPFVETIQSQYSHRKKLFENLSVLPDMELHTMPAVQSIGGHASGFSDWFEALEAMTEQAMSYDFDVAIIGCGAYGFPLACRLKQAGKRAIHMGGATQLLFGIRGRRWDDRSNMQRFFNQYWARPSSSETPTHAKNVENGCYW